MGSDMRTRAQAADPIAIDLPYLATTYGVPEPDLQTLLDAPTTELVQDFLQSLRTKGEEFDSLQAEKLRVDVELENTVRTSDSKVKAQKTAVIRQTKEIEELRTSLKDVESARDALATELEHLRSSTSGSTAETQTLRQRIESLEASNREALALVENKSTEKDRVATELSEQHSKLLALRRDVSRLEERNQTLENAAASQKFKEQSLQQEIDLLKRNNEWHSNELQTRTQEHAKFRKERNARIASLQRELEDGNSALDALKRTEASLRQRLEELQGKADEVFARVANLQEEAARKEQDFRAELETTKRLADLQAQNASTHKTRLQEVQTQSEQIKEDAANEIGHLQAEVEMERSDKEQAERKVAELELTVERLERQPRTSRPGTPMRNGGLEPTTPGAAHTDSPAMPGSIRKIIGGLSFTQLYTNYTNSQSQLEDEKRKNEQLASAMDDLINDMEARRPEFEELHAEQDRLENEVLDYSRLLDDSDQNRIKAVKDSEKWQGEAEAASRENQILRQQLRDLSAQIKMLLVEIQSRDQGLGDLSADERLELERAARGELDDGALDDLTSTGRLISQRLVIFHEVSDLQAQNEKLLRLTRELGDKMEGQEAQEQARQSASDAVEVEELRRQVDRYKDELQATATQIDSYTKERDMFRRMLQHRGQLPADTDLQSMFGQSIIPATPTRNGLEPPATPRSKDVEDLNKLLKEQQTFFDQYRNESSTDRRMLKDQVDALGREKSNLQSEIARAQSQLTLAAERYDMLQSNYNLLRTENSELQKRSQQMAENAAKQDLRTQQVAEELIESRSMAESLRHETANAKAEKELWKRIETRLTEDNHSLTEERSRLNKHVTDLQNMQNERELAESENRRRTQGRVETLELELGETKKKLEAELEEGRKTTLRREYEEGQSRTRIDDLAKSLGNVREELVAAKTTRDQFQARVDEMRIELRSAEEKLVALQPRPTPRPGQQDGEPQTDDSNEELPAEQRLALEVSELRRDLELSKTELEKARQQVEQFRAIAQSTEEELANFTQTTDQYKEETDHVITEKDSRIKELEQRIEDQSSELTTTSNELSELRTKADDNSRQLSEQKASFDSELSRLRDDSERHAEEKKLYQEDLKAQAEIAQQAQQSYENELLKHAEAAKALQNVRKEYNDLRTEIATIKSEAEAAKASLERGEEGWAEQRDRFEREFEELKRRRHDADEQNKLLHQQLEVFSTELASLRQHRTVADTPGSQPRDGTPSGDSNMQEVIKFLRREKEIVDVQYELSIQESKRMQQQLEYANNQLEESRQKLAEERRQSSDKANSEASTTKLMQTINELNLFRESSTTLRNEVRQARERLDEKTKEVERLITEVEPLKGRVAELESELDNKEGEMKLLTTDRDHWRERTQTIISKYDRVDPAELEDLRKQVEDLSAEKQRIEAEQVNLQEQVNEFDDRVESEKAAATQALTERLDRFRVQAKDQDRKRMERIREVTTEKDGLASELENLKAELENVKTALAQSQADASTARQDNDEEGQIHEDKTGTEAGEEQTALRTRIADAEASATEHSNRATELHAEMESLQSQIHELEAQVTELQQLNNTGSEQTLGQATSADSKTLEKLKQDLTVAQQEVETLRANASMVSSENQTNIQTTSVTGEGTLAEQVTQEVAKLRNELEQQHELAKAQMKEEHDRRIENMKNNLRRQLREERDRMRPQVEEEVAAEHSAEVQKLKDEHNAAMDKLKEDHQIELQKLDKDGNAAVSQAEAAAPVKSEVASTEGSVDLPDLTAAQARELVKNNATVKALVTSNIRALVDKQTEKLKTTITEKDAEIARLQSSLDNVGSGGESESNGTSREDLEKQLDVAKKEKEAAVRQAIENAEKKAKVQISQRDMAQARLTVVKKAATETPEKPVGEVWEIAEKARPVAKPAALTSAASPAAKPVLPNSPSQMQSPSFAQTPEQIEQEKLRARQERFGLPTDSTTTSAPAGLSFGQPSAAFKPPSTGTFGQPSQVGTSNRTSSFGLPPNPHAAAFTPGTADSTATANAGTALAASRNTAQSAIPQPGGASKLPRIPPTRQASGSGGPGLQIQGAAAGTNTTQQPGASRGGLQQSGLPRGGAPRGGGRGGARGGGPANAGQKRQHEGGDGGDGKRIRGGGPSA